MIFKNTICFLRQWNKITWHIALQSLTEKLFLTGFVILILAPYFAWKKQNTIKGVKKLSPFVYTMQ